MSALRGQPSRASDAERRCRQQGLALTVQRRVIIECLATRTDHPTADQVYAAVKDRLPGLSRTTVYRILDALVQVGAITRICHPGSTARFDPKIHRHHHLVCMHCDAIIDIEDPNLNQVAWPDVGDSGFEISDYHIHFRGRCARCARRPKRKGVTTPGPNPRCTAQPARAKTRRSGQARGAKS